MRLQEIERQKMSEKVASKRRKVRGDCRLVKDLKVTTNWGRCKLEKGDSSKNGSRDSSKNAVEWIRKTTGKVATEL